MLQLYERCRLYIVTIAPYHIASTTRRTYVIECSFSSTLIIYDMKRMFKKIFKSKKSSLGSLHGRGPAASTSISTGTTGITDLMLSIPACDSDGTASAQVTAGVSVHF